MLRDKCVSAPRCEKSLLAYPFYRPEGGETVVFELEDPARPVEWSRPWCEHCQVSMGNHGP
jgi:hypothetical protein